MNIMYEEKEFKTNDGKVVTYYVYYVVVYGVKVYLKPIDKTGADLLKAVIDNA